MFVRIENVSEFDHLEVAFHLRRKDCGFWKVVPRWTGGFVTFLSCRKIARKKKRIKISEVGLEIDSTKSIEERLEIFLERQRKENQCNYDIFKPSFCASVSPRR